MLKQQINTSGIENLALQHNLIYEIQNNDPLSNLGIYALLLKESGFKLLNPTQVIQEQERIAALEAKITSLEKESRTDGLTQLYNRRGFDEKLQEEYTRFQRYNTIFSLVTLDLNKFKDINDLYGHAVGDSALTQFSNLLKENTRSIDYVARTGGDEFSIILPETNLSKAGKLISRINNKIKNQEFKYNNNLLNVSASIGIAEMQVDYTLDDLKKAADKASYISKNNGGTKIYLMSNYKKEIYTPILKAA